MPIFNLLNTINQYQVTLNSLDNVNGMSSFFLLCIVQDKKNYHDSTVLNLRYIFIKPCPLFLNQFFHVK